MILTQTRWWFLIKYDSIGAFVLVGVNFKIWSKITLNSVFFLVSIFSIQISHGFCSEEVEVQGDYHGNPRQSNRRDINM